MNPNLQVEETRDADLVWKIASSPEVMDRISNDEWTALGDHVRRTHVGIITRKPENHIILVLDGKRPVGCFVMDAKKDGLFEIHTFLLKSCRGADAIQAGKMAMAFAFRLPETQKLISYCPGNNPESYLFARLCGWHKAGVAAFKWVKDGISYPLRIVEISRKDLCPSQ